MTAPDQSVLVVSRGSTWSATWPVSNPTTGDPLDLTGWTGRGQIRAGYGSPTVLFDWPQDAAIECTLGEVTVHVSAEQSSAWTWDRGVYGIELVPPSGAPIVLAQGPVLVSPEVALEV